MIVYNLPPFSQRDVSAGVTWLQCSMAKKQNRNCSLITFTMFLELQCV